MKKILLILICVMFCFRAIPQTGTLYCDCGDNKDHLTISLYLFQNNSYKLVISDMCVEDMPSDLFVSTGRYSETTTGNYILTDTYGNNMTLCKEGPVPVLAFDNKAPVYLRNRRLFYYEEVDSTFKRHSWDDVYSYFTKKEIKEYRIKNKKKYNLSDGTYHSIRDIGFGLTLQKDKYILQAECFRYENITLSQGVFHRHKNILVLVDDSGIVLYLFVAKDGLIIKYETGLVELSL